MDSGYQWLEGVADRMRNAVAKGAAPTPERLTIRQLLQKFGYSRRGSWIVGHIRNGFERFNLTMDRDLSGWVDSTLTIELDSVESGASTRHAPPDPTHRIGSLEAANKSPLSVKPDSPLSEATTIMQLHDYSQLPVMQGERDVRGVVSWKSIGQRLSLGRQCEFVRQCIDSPQVVLDTMPLAEAITTIAEHGYVLVQSTDRSISGIVTATDLSFQFMQLAGPFLFIGEIEGRLRNLIHGRFTLEQLQAASGPEGGKPIEGSGDMTLGGYCRLLEHKGNWERLGLNIDRVEFVKHLHAVREIRNNVMHFNPDGPSEEDTKKLRDIARFFENLERISTS